VKKINYKTKKEEILQNTEREKEKLDSKISELEGEFNEKSLEIQKIEKNYKKAVEDQEGWKEKYTNLLRQLEEANPKIQENHSFKSCSLQVLTSFSFFSMIFSLVIFSSNCCFKTLICSL